MNFSFIFKRRIKSTGLLCEGGKQMNIALLIAGGAGTRMKQDIPKQFLTVNEKPVIVYTLEAFQKHVEIDVIAVVCLEGWEHVLEAYARQFNITKLQHIFPGGDCGQASIRNGIYALEKEYEKSEAQGDNYYQRIIDRRIDAIPSSEISSNLECKQNPGY